MLKNFKQPFFYNTNGCLWMDEKKVTDNWVTAWKVSKYGPEITPYLYTFHAVSNWSKVILVPSKWVQEMCCSCFIFQNIFKNKKWSLGLSMLISKFQCQDFLMAFKKCCINIHNNVAQQLKEMTDIHPNKIESEANSETFAATVKCILNIARHHMPE